MPKVTPKNSYRGQSVEVRSRDGRVVTGTLRGYGHVMLQLRTTNGEYMEFPSCTVEVKTS